MRVQIKRRIPMPPPQKGFPDRRKQEQKTACRKPLRHGNPEVPERGSGPKTR